MKAVERRFLKDLEDFDSVEAYVREAVGFIKDKVDGKVLSSVSGGVDSTVVSVLLNKALGEDFRAVHIDTGYMRKKEGRNECEIVKQRLSKLLGKDRLLFRDERERFYSNTFGIEDAEEKRVAFREVYEETLNEILKEDNYTAISQGTILPDIEETEAELKSQNNVSVNFDVKNLIEPIAGLTKPQVRRVAEELGLSKQVYARQPFPGPGLLIRTVGSINRSKLKVEKRANDTLEQQLEGYLNKEKVARYDPTSGRLIPFQYFSATFDYSNKKKIELGNFDLDGKTVKIDGAYTLGTKVTGKEVEAGEMSRTYGEPLVIEGDFTTRDLMKLGEELPKKLNVPRVLYKVAGEEGNYGVAMRVVNSMHAREAEPFPLPVYFLEETSKKIKSIEGVGPVFYDITPKPPATIEYE